MRFIDISHLSLSATWEVGAKDALDALMLEHPSNRIDYIDAMRKKTWANDLMVKPMISLLNVNNPKCWYSEAYITGDPEVDHFRPKSKNAKNPFAQQYDHLGTAILNELDDTNTKGWWFLAFDYKNFRLCNCTVNQLRHDKQLKIIPPGTKAKGKADFFPLRKGRPVAIGEAGLADEVNCLLDPCNPDDPTYLAFDNEGLPYAFYDKYDPEADWIKCRVDTSIAIYHLDRTQLNDCRKHKWRECTMAIESMYQSLVVEKNAVKSVDSAKYFIENLADKSKEYSAVAIDCIRHFDINYKYTWIYKLLDKAYPGIQLIK